MPKILSKPIRKKRFTAMLDKFAGGAIALFFAYIVAASTGNTSESMEALSASTISIFILLFYKLMLSYDSVEKPEKESAPLSIMYYAAFIIPLITFLLILGSINPWLSTLAFVIFLICFAFLIAHFHHGYKEEKNAAERISTPNESNKKIAKRADEKFFPYIIFVIGLLYGLGFAIDWNIQVGGLWDVSFKTQLETEKSAWDIVAAIGSLLAGLGTVGLLAFGWIKASDWLTQMKSDKRINFIIETSNNLITVSDSFHYYFKTKVYPYLPENSSEEKYLESKEKYEKYVNELKTHDLLNQVSIQLDTLNHLISDNINLENETKEIVKNYRQLHIKVFTNLQYKPRDEMRSLTLGLVTDSKRIQRSIINELLK
jgi:hypothetical protein